MGAVRHGWSREGEGVCASQGARRIPDAFGYVLQFGILMLQDATIGPAEKSTNLVCIHTILVQ